jgi:alkylation response protein AidB-like acyl-CoA dehydrogenase
MTDDSDLLRAAVRDALKQLSSSADVRRAMATACGYEDASWRRLAGELGLPGLTLPEELGGAGLTAAELGIAFEEAGASLLCSPLFATAGLAVPLLTALGDAEALAEYGPRIASGELTATVALAEDSGKWQPGLIRATATRAAGGTAAGGWRLTGVKNYVVDGATAGLVLAVVTTGNGELAVFGVDDTAEGADSGIGREQLVTLDQTRKQARLTFNGTPANGTPARRIGTGDASAAIARATAVSRALLAAEQVGGAQRCLDMTVEYAKTRIQFGRAIGSFQAIKQRLAEMLILVESARSAAYAALDAASAQAPGELEHIAAIAALTAGEAFTHVTAQAIQLHGGIGFTWEHDAHLYFKRARASAILLGTASELTDLIGRQLEALI